MSSEAWFLVLALPGGLEALYEAAGWDLRQPEPEGWEVPVPRLVQSEARRGNRILAPPPGPDDVLDPSQWRSRL
jgi:hypothetical protein